MFGLIKKIFVGILTGLFDEFNHPKCVSLRIKNVWLSLLLLI